MEKRFGGGVVATTNRGDVVGVDAAGTLTVLFDSQSADKPHGILDPSGHTYSIIADNQLSLYSTSQPGALLGSQPVTPIYLAGPIPESELVFLPEPEGIDMGGIETYPRFVAGRIMDANGQVQASFPLEEIMYFRVTPTHIVHATKTNLIKTTLQGQETWRIPIGPHRFEVSENGEISIVRLRNKVSHYQENALISETPTDKPVWNIAISSSGVYSVATTKTDVLLFESGLFKQTVSLSVLGVASADVNDYGDVLIGAHNSNHTPHILYINKEGEILWETEGEEPHNHGWLPIVQFAAEGESFAVQGKAGIDYYSAERR